MVTIEKYCSHRHQRVSELSVLKEQSQFTVANIAELLKNLKPTELPHVILADDAVVGFFLFDTGYNKMHEFCPPNSLGVRALLVDSRYQGKGIAKQAVRQFLPFVKSHFPMYEALYLTVNCRNNAAYECYLKAGFEDTGDLYLGGPAGPQHIMKQELSNLNAA